VLSELERKLLNLARSAIRAGREKFVCYAIDNARISERVATYHELWEAKNRLRQYISRSLNYRGTLGNWLAAKNRNSWMDSELQRKARIAWITWMLGEEVVVGKATQRAFALYLKPKPPSINLVN
jgi:hypothetical protein